MDNRQNTTTSEMDISLIASPGHNKTQHATTSDEDMTAADESWAELRIINRLLNKPKLERDRIVSMLNIQHEINEIEFDYHDRLRQLELEFADRYAKVFQKRSDIVAGRRLPTADEIDSKMFPDLKYMTISDADGNNDLSPTPDDDDEGNNVNERGDADRNGGGGNGKLRTGIKNFWLEVLKQSVFVDEIKSEDEDALTYLCDISVVETANQYTFSFQFLENNPYFVNRVLQKKYFLRNVKADTQRLDFQGMEIYRTEGTRIVWKAGRDLGREEEVVNQYNPATNKYRRVKRVQMKDSFFNFFEPGVTELPDKSTNSELAELLHRDFMLGDYLHDCLVPGAIKLYFGVGITDNDEDDGDDEVDGLAGDLTSLNIYNAEDGDSDDDDDDEEDAYSYEGDENDDDDDDEGNSEGDNFHEVSNNNDEESGIVSGSAASFQRQTSGGGNNSSSVQQAQRRV